MSRAEERALEAYPIDPIVLRELRTDYRDLRHAFTKGYHQAEKDNELTWEDISKIISIDQQVCGTMGISHYTYYHQQTMEEVLKRFKDYKK